MYSEDVKFFAGIVESAVFQALLIAYAKPDEAKKWFALADKLETKFKTEYGAHYAAVLYPDQKITFT